MLPRWNGCCCCYCCIIYLCFINLAIFFLVAAWNFLLHSFLWICQEFFWLCGRFTVFNLNFNTESMFLQLFHEINKKNVFLVSLQMSHCTRWTRGVFFSLFLHILISSRYKYHTQTHITLVGNCSFLFETCTRMSLRSRMCTFCFFVKKYL